MTDPRPFVVEWYRVDVSRRVATILGLAAPVMLCGCICVALSVRSAPTPDAVRLALTCAGFVCIVGGGFRAILGLRRLLEQDTWVALRSDTLVLHDGTAETSIAWDAIEDVVAADDGVHVTQRDGATTTLPPRFAGVTPKELARRIAAVRRRVLFGLEV